ncbi:hypothetical protein BD414DRAFT_421976 [Trametes punicea]|nr:hypothetical protein BD414DRAFT_421976 [Trametes punicea]
MTFVAPIPRRPLADVLRHLDVSWASGSPDGSPRAQGAAKGQGSPRSGEHPKTGLGLVLGSACLPIQLPRPHLELEPPSQSPSRYSRRLRSIAPPPLQLASPTPRAPLRTLTQAQTPVLGSAYRTPAFAAFANVPLDGKCLPASGDVSVSPQSDRRPSIASTMTTQSTAPTSLLFPGESENVYPGRGANSTHTDRLPWQRSFSQALESALSPLPPRYTYATPTSGKAVRSPLTPSRKSSIEQGDPFTPGLPPDAPPPRLRRTEWVPLPDLTDEELASPDLQALSPLRADLRLDLGVEDLLLRAERCAETIARASMCLCSCSLLRNPESIADLCEKLRATLASVQRALEGTPSDFTAEGSDAKRTWYAKHWQIISSLDRNLNLFYLLAHQVEDRPPRIHRLASILDKLSTYQAKFADLARRIVLSHEKLRFLSLRNQLSIAHVYARSLTDNDTRSALRHDSRAARQEGRTRRREIREELARVRGRIHAIRERAELDVSHIDEMMTICDEDDDLAGDKEGGWGVGQW